MPEHAIFLAAQADGCTFKKLVARLSQEEDARRAAVQQLLEGNLIQHVLAFNNVVVYDKILKLDIPRSEYVALTATLGSPDIFGVLGKHSIDDTDEFSPKHLLTESTRILHK